MRVILFLILALMIAPSGCAMPPEAQARLDESRRLESWHWSPARTQTRLEGYEDMSLEELRALHDQVQSRNAGFFNNELAYVRYALALRFEGRSDEVGRAEYERWISGAARNPIEWTEFGRYLGSAGYGPGYRYRSHSGLPEAQAALGVIMRENGDLCRARYYLSQALEAGYDRRWVERGHDEVNREIEAFSVAALNDGAEPLRCYREGE